jgi:hypothetical protein
MGKEPRSLGFLRCGAKYWDVACTGKGVAFDQVKCTRVDFSGGRWPRAKGLGMDSCA